MRQYDVLLLKTACSEARRQSFQGAVDAEPLLNAGDEVNECLRQTC